MVVTAKEVWSDLARHRAAITILVLLASGSVGADTSVDPGALRGQLESRGFTPTQAQAAQALLERAEARGLPPSALANRMREGIARRADPSTILGVATNRFSDLEKADDLTRRCAKEGIAVRERDRSLLRLADSFAMGVTPGDVVAVLPAASRAGRDFETVSRAAEVMGRLNQAGLPPAGARDVLAAAIAAGWSKDQMEGLVDVFRGGRRLGVSPEKVQQIMVNGIRDKKEPARLVDDMKSSAKPDSPSHSSESHSPAAPSSGSSGSGSPKGGSPKGGSPKGGSPKGGSPKGGSPKGGKGGAPSHGSGSGQKAAPPRPSKPPTNPHH